MIWQGSATCLPRSFTRRRARRKISTAEELTVIDDRRWSEPALLIISGKPGVDAFSGSRRLGVPQEIQHGDLSTRLRGWSMRSRATRRQGSDRMRSIPRCLNRQLSACRCQRPRRRSRKSTGVFVDILGSEHVKIPATALPQNAQRPTAKGPGTAGQSNTPPKDIEASHVDCRRD